MIAVHATVPFKLVRAASSYFRVQDGEPRCIVNISSTSGLHGNACVFKTSSCLSLDLSLPPPHNPRRSRRRKRRTESIDSHLTDARSIGRRFRGQANYALAKAGITGLTKTIAKVRSPA